MAAKPGFQLDRLSAILLGVLALAGILLAGVMVYITERSEKQIQEIKDTKVVAGLNALSAVPSNAEANSDIPANLSKAYGHKKRVPFYEVDFNETAFSQLEKLDRATELCLLYSTFDNKWLHYLKGMKSLQTLNLEGSSINGEGMQTVGQMSQLTVLVLTASKIKDDDLAYVPPNLTELIVEKMPLTDAALQNLPKLEHLHEFRAIYTNVADGGMQYLAKFKTLRKLLLGHTDVGDAGLADIAKLQLGELDLSSTKITDAGMKELARMEKPGQGGWLTLDISHTAVTDKGLADLTKLKQLCILICADCPGITQRGVAKLQAALPNCVVKSQAEPNKYDKYL